MKQLRFSEPESEPAMAQRRHEECFLGFVLQIGSRPPCKALVFSGVANPYFQNASRSGPQRPRVVILLAGRAADR